MECVLVGCGLHFKIVQMLSAREQQESFTVLFLPFRPAIRKRFRATGADLKPPVQWFEAPIPLSLEGRSTRMSLLRVCQRGDHLRLGGG